MKKLSKKEEDNLDKFIGLCKEKFKKNFELDKKFSKVIPGKASLIVLKEVKTGKCWFSTINIRKQLELISNFMEIPQNFLNISIDTKLSLIFLTVTKGEYILINIGGKVIHKTVNLESQETRDWMGFYEEILFMTEHGIC